MANKELRVKIQDAYDTEFNWKTNDPVLLAGQVAFSSDKYGKYKVGDGVKTWNQLEYVKTKWEDIDGKPSTFNPPAHTHTISQISDIGNANVKHANTAGSANAVAWANVSGKPTTFNPATHNHDDRYYTETEMNTKLGEKANTSALTLHTGNSDIHVTSTDKTNWNAAKAHADKAHAPSNAQANQNAFSNVTINGTTISADVPTDTLNFVAGSNVQITPDAVNDKITISATDTKYTHPGTHPASMITQDASHRFVTDAEKNTWNGKANANHTHNNYLSITGGSVTDLNSIYANSNVSTCVSPLETALASSPFARSLWHDHFAFLSSHVIKDSQVMNNGSSSWIDGSSLNLKPLFIHKEYGLVQLLTKEQLARRFTIFNDQLAYSGISWVEIGVTYREPFSECEIHIEISSDGSSWKTAHKSRVTVSGKPYYLKIMQFENSKYVRFTFTKKTNITTGTMYLCCIKGLTTRKGDQGLGIEFEKPYDWDIYRNIYPHENNGADLGTEIRKWKSVFANQFHGNLIGNATTASKLGSESKGSATQPVYLNAGVPTACTYTLGKSVPSNAVFTDTTYSVASGSTNGLMSSTDKTKLDGIATGANKYVLPTAGLNALGGVKTTSQVTSASGYTACPIIGGVPYYKDTNTTYTLGSFGITTTAAELNFCDGVTSNIQTQLNGKAPSSHNHSASQITGLPNVVAITNSQIDSLKNL